MMREKRIPCANGIWSVGGRNWNEDFEMPADDCNCTGHFGVDAFCLAAGQGAEFESCDPGLGVWVKCAVTKNARQCLLNCYIYFRATFVYNSSTKGSDECDQIRTV